MNIYPLDDDPTTSAEFLPDQLLRPRAADAAQIISTVGHTNRYPQATMLGESIGELHPCVVWAGAARANFFWLSNHLFSIIDEMKRRGLSKRIDPQWEKVLVHSRHIVDLVPSGRLTPFVKVVPGIFRPMEATVAYRAFLLKQSTVFPMTWTRRAAPGWFQ